MNSEDLNIQDLLAFVAVADSESVVTAANKLGLSQSAVTRRLQSLEEDLGVILIHRDARPLKLTSHGREAYRFAKIMLKAAQNLRHSLGADSDVRGTFRFGISMSLADTMMNHPTECLRRDYPRLHLEAITGESTQLAERVAKRELDAALVLLPSGKQFSGDLAGEELFTEYLSVVASKKLPINDEVSLEELLPYSWVLNPVGCSARDALQNALNRLQLPLKIAFETSSAQLKLSLIESGVGLGIFLPSVVRASRSPDALKLIATTDFKQPISYWLVQGPELGRLSEPLACFRAALGMGKP
jgi:DNA-binding transcriptional LysR family regulator